ncbi:hypothetical protein M9979_03000 [Sphingomonas sp. RP10(2022)]|uniref:Uncharacterized protein n=1 Tax=Sphingomonas liriopis TaxID=2949094 RepID=A0A9X2HXG3_9SPHN|nr:hypothetical protein [Sphingomonas liriopis]MCP3733845.1 hypothetical protein [Sphingomonas liriopis]
MKGRHVQVGLLFIAVCVVIGLAIALFTMGRTEGAREHADDNVAATAAPVGISPAPAAAKAPATVAAATPDFLVTDELRRNRPTWEELGQGPDAVVFCVGAKARLTNGSARPLNLNVVVAESDDSSPLGTVAPGQTISFDPGNEGTWNLTDAGDGGPLFQYEVQKCDRPAAATVTATQAKTLRGRCRLKVSGVKYIDGPCYYYWYVDHTGWGISDKPDESGYLATLEIDQGEATGMWNGRPGGDKINNPLGDGDPLTRNGACWAKGEDEICLWA